MPDLARPPHLMIVTAPYYKAITDDLMKGVLTEIATVGATYETFEVAGAFELPVAVSLTLERKSQEARRFDGYITLGCVIRGETSHYDLLCNEVARALQSMAVSNGLALGFGLLTCENGEQARVRASVDGKNKGGEAARACLDTLRLKQTLGLYPD